MMKIKNAGYSSAVGVQIGIRLAIQREMLKVACVVTEFGEILRRLPKMKDQRATSQLVQLLYDPMFDPNNLERIMKKLKDCQKVSQNIQRNRSLIHFEISL